MNTKTIETGAEILEFDAKTGEILVSGDPKEMKQIRATKVQAFKLLKHDDFAFINGTWEAKRDGLLKILSALPISYSWKIKSKELTSKHSFVMGELAISIGNTVRSAESMCVCELTELKGNGGLHFMNARAETRALKRAIETLFGSVINYYVIHHLLPNQQYNGAA